MDNVRLEYCADGYNVIIEEITSCKQLEKRLEEIKAEYSKVNSEGIKCIFTVNVVMDGIGSLSIALDEKCVLMFYDEIEDFYLSSLGDSLCKGVTKDLYDFGQLAETEKMYIVSYENGLEAVKDWLLTKN